MSRYGTDVSVEWNETTQVAGLVFRGSSSSTDWVQVRPSASPPDSAREQLMLTLALSLLHGIWDSLLAVRLWLLALCAATGACWGLDPSVSVL